MLASTLPKKLICPSQLISKHMLKLSTQFQLTQTALKKSHEDVTETERTAIRNDFGQLNWLSNISRPEISFTVSSISSKIRSATVAEIKETNKLIKFVQNTPSHIHFPRLDISNTRLIMFSDASYNNLNDGGSQGAHLVLLADQNNKSCPISWSSNRIKRVARSTLSAETLAFTDGCDNSVFLKNLSRGLYDC